MLSVEPAASIEAAAQPPTPSDENCWLPDFDSPDIIIALPPLACSGPQSLDDCMMHPSLTKPNVVEPTDTLVRPQSLPGHPLYTDSPAAVAASPAIDPTALAHELPKILACSKNRADAADAADATTVSLLDRLGLNFDFHTDPAIEAICDSPLYLSFVSHDLATSLRDDAAAIDEEPAALLLPSLPESPLDPVSPASPLSLESESCSNKSSTRRTSIAGMLKKRLSKGSDTNGETAPQIISPIPSTTDAQDNADNVVFVVATDDIQPTQDIEPAESVLSHNSDDATGDSRITPSNEHVTTVVELPAVAAVTFVAGISNPEPNGHPVTQRKSEDTPVPGMPTNDASEVCDPIHATSVDTPTQSPSDAPLPEADTVAFAPAPETPIQHSDGAEVVGSRPPPPPRRPSIHRHLDRRSSRILEGLTRKVQHVRQTTSMVLRRSVGSHMSFRPATPPDIFQGSVVGLAGLRGCGLNDVELEPEHMPPQYSVSYEEPGGTRTETNNADDCTSVLGTGGEDNPTFVEDVLRASSHINDVNGKPVDVSTARSSTALNATSDKFHASNHMDTFSRKLSSVRHGTNVAVRNSVTRVKNIFVPKRSVAA